MSVEYHKNNYRSPRRHHQGTWTEEKRQQELRLSDKGHIHAEQQGELSQNVKDAFGNNKFLELKVFYFFCWNFQKKEIWILEQNEEKDLEKEQVW